MGEATGASSGGLDARELLALASAVAKASGALAEGANDAQRIDQLTALERIKSAAAAAQARITDAFKDSQLRATEASRKRAADEGRRLPKADTSVAHQVALARRESPYAGRQHLNLAEALVHDLPCTMAALERGDISEQRAMIVVTETADLSREDRMTVDAEIIGDLPGLGDTELRHLLRRIALRIDEEAAMRRRAKARAGRDVTGRILHDGTALVTARISDVDYAAVMNSLNEKVSSLKAQGDPRSRGQIRGDLFVQRLTLSVFAEGRPVAVKLVLGVESLLGASSEPGHVIGVGPVPAAACRELIKRASAEQRATLQGCSGSMRPAPSWRWSATAGRSRLTSQSWIDLGLCEECNYAKESPGWSQMPISEQFERHRVMTMTPTGHVYESQAPPMPGTPVAGRRPLIVELYASNLVLAA